MMIIKDMQHSLLSFVADPESFGSVRRKGGEAVLEKTHPLLVIASRAKQGGANLGDLLL